MIANVSRSRRRVQNCSAEPLRLLVVSLCALLLSLASATSEALAEDSWQRPMALANSYQRLRMLPNALAELKQVVQDPEGARQARAWEMLVEISAEVKDLETRVWALEKGRTWVSAPAGAQMQEQLDQIHKHYGRLRFAASGRKRLSSTSMKLEVIGELGDAEAQAYFDRSCRLLAEHGRSSGMHYLPAGSFLLDGRPLEVVAGKDTSVEITSEAEVSFAFEVAGLGGMRSGGFDTGVPGYVAGLEVGFGPRIKLRPATSLLVLARPIGGLGSRSSVVAGQGPSSSAGEVTALLGASLEVGLEFRVGRIAVSPRFGYGLQALPRGLGYSGDALASSGTAMVLSGTYIVPSLAHGPRLGVQVLLNPAASREGRAPSFFVGLRGGPVWATPLWGSVLDGSDVAIDSSSLAGFDEPAGDREFRALQVGGPESKTSVLFGELQGFIGLELPTGAAAGRAAGGQKFAAHVGR